MTHGTLRLSIDLLPFIKVREEHEVERASRARKPKTQKIKKIPVRFPSVNTMYPIARGRGKYLSDEGRLYKEYIGKELDKLEFKIPSYATYSVTYVFFMTHEMMYTKDGELSQHDVSNFLKATEDAFFDWLGESDASVFDVQGSKRMTVGDPKLVILVSEADESTPIYHSGKVLDPYEIETDEKTVLS